jgi:choline-glycine betaine transporter
MGGAAMDLQKAGTDIAGAGGLEDQLFTTLDAFPLAKVASVLVMALVAIFFVSGADAASIVMGTLSEHGTQEPSRATVVFWGVATGAVAAVMLLAGGEDALNGLQSITIVAALPFVVVMVGLAVALVRDLRADPLIVRRKYGEEVIEQAVIAGVTEHGDDFVLAVEPAEPETAQPDNAQRQSAQPDSAQPQSAQPDSAQPDAQSDNAQSVSAQRRSAQPQSAQPDSAQRRSAQPVDH